jgi:hypothetical protein
VRREPSFSGQVALETLEPLQSLGGHTLT